MIQIIIYLVLAACAVWLFYARGKQPKHKAGYGLVLLAVAILNTGQLYYLRTYTASQRSPDANHSVRWEQHGDPRYVAPAQNELVRIARLGGLAVLLLGAALLFTRDNLNQRTPR